MRSHLKIMRIGAAWLGALTVAGAAAAAHAAGTATQPYKVAEGVIASVDFSSNKLDIHPAAGDDVIVSVGPTTKWSRGTAVFPSTPSPPPQTKAESPPSPDAYIGLYVRALYDPSTMLASYVWLNAPQPLHAEGLVHSASATGLSVDLSGGGTLLFALDTNTVVRLDGQPVSGSPLVQGDPVAVTFFLKPTENLATLVMARTAPPRTFSGILLVPAVRDPATNAFSVKGENQTLDFTVDDKTLFFINDKPAALADLKPNQPVFVQYLADGSVFLARRVAQSQKPSPTTGPNPSTGPNPKTGPSPNTGPNPSPSPSTGGGTNTGKGTSPSNGTNPEPHPELDAALAALEQAKLHLIAAARDFGGHRAAAASLTDQAIKQVQAAIQFDLTGK